jgi:hypothetical protein
MKRLSMIPMLVVVLSLTATVVSAAMPISYYLVSLDTPCRLPDAKGVPQEAVEFKASMHEVGERFVQMDCLGTLPAGSEVPKAPIKLVYGNTKIYCATWYGDQFLLTQAYTAIVTPQRTSEISCLFRIF